MAKECILCGKCLSVCPLLKATNREELGPRAKADLSRLLEERPELLASRDVKALAGLCLGCHRCKTACSQGVDVPDLVARLRSAHPDLKSWLWKQWLSNTEKWGVGASVAGVIPNALVPEKFGRQLKMLAGLKAGPGLTPCLKPKSFPDTYRGERMLLFSGCVATHVRPVWETAAVRLLNGLGADLVSGGFQCCGCGLKAAGFHEESLEMAERNVAVWRGAGRPRLVVLCASCLAGLAGYDCFRDEGEKDAWQASLTPLSSLVDGIHYRVTDDASASVAYHRPCHGSDADGDYLAAALGDRLVAATDGQCCGFGGIMRLAAPELTEGVNTACLEAFADAECVVTGCSACVGQLANTVSDDTRVGHWLELIA